MLRNRRALALQGDYAGEPQAPAVNRVNILVVDDLPEKHVVYQVILEELGQNLVFVSSGEAALKQMQNQNQEFAVILLDVNMPGMDGFQTAAEIRKQKNGARTPIIFLTAFTDEVHAAQGYASGAVDYLPTPIVPEILRTKVRVFIELSQMRQQAAQQAIEQERRAAAEDAMRRAEFQVKVSETVSRAQNPTDVLNALVRLCASALADASFACLYKEGGEFGPLIWSWKDLDNAGNVPQEFIKASMPWIDAMIQEAAASGQYVLMESLPPPSIPADQLNLFALPDLHSALVMPLMIQKRLYGMLVLAQGKDRPAYSLDIISLCHSVTSRVATALENSFLIERIREADQRKDEFLATLAHELRNPLAPISNALQIMMMGNLPPDRLAEVREIMQRQVQHMKRLVDDLLDVSRITKGKIELKKEKVRLSAILESAMETTKPSIEQAGHHVSLQIPDEPIYLEGDVTRLSQVFSNLLNNAVKYTNPGGKIHVSVHQDRTHVSVTVRDTGIGIPQAMLPKIFDMFTQVDSSIERSRGGLGIGLKLVKELCELHGGKVSVVSAGNGTGSEFTVRLPMAKAPEKSAEPVLSKNGASQARRILVVDDNEASAKTLQWMLELLGNEVHLAFNGNAALEITRDFTPEIVLLDIGLPDMNGYDVCKKMREDRRFDNVTFVAQTGWGQAEHRRRSLEAGFDHHLVKPVDMKTLQDILHASQKNEASRGG